MASDKPRPYAPIGVAWHGPTGGTTDCIELPDYPWVPDGELNTRKPYPSNGDGDYLPSQPWPPGPAPKEPPGEFQDDIHTRGENPKDRIGVTKPSLHLVPAAATIREAKVFELGAAKYGPYNWRKNAVKATVYVSALLRHILSYLDGEDVDPESGQSHVAHARACTGILLDAMDTGNLVDDRPTKGVAAELIRELQTQKKAA